MILVCDSEVSERAIKIRNTLLDLGSPSCVSSISDIKNHTPFCLIITFSDVFGEVRRTPFDDVFVIAIGDGFVNTALNATQAKNLESAISMARSYLRGKYCDKHNEGNYCGAFVPPFYFSERFFEIYSNMVAPTETEYLIFKLIVFCTQSSVYANTGLIRDYCFSCIGGDSNVISAHISSLNKKIYEAYGKKIIKSKRFKGYYLDKT